MTRRAVNKQLLAGQAARVAEVLAVEYADAECALVFHTPLELLVATILSAQCTDQRVNLVTPALFQRFPTVAALAQADRADLEQAIQSTGFFRNKAKHIQGCCQRLVDQFGGQVPLRLDDLITLPGVGRKTANVVLGTAFGIASGVVVDTHVGRIALRLGLTKASDPIRAERDLMAILPPEQWVSFSHRLIWHGRRVCLARKPRCEQCQLASVCARVGVAPRSGARKTGVSGAKTARKR